MTIKEAIAYFGTQVALARALGIGCSAISRWKSVPPWHQKTIELLTKGELKAEIKEKPPRGEVHRVSVDMPLQTAKRFKLYCKKENLSMSQKLIELVENTID